MTMQKQFLRHISEQRLQVEESGSGRPRFSVIICTYNRRNTLLATLASLRRQTLASIYFEVIIIDNGSTDDTLNAVRTYVNACAQQARATEECWRVHCLVEEQKGLAHMRNSGFQAASGDIAIFLDDDTLVDPYFLEYLLFAYEETGADAIGGRVELRWEAPRPQWLNNAMLEMLGYFSPVKQQTPLPANVSFSSSNFSVSIAALRQIGGFSPGKQLHPSINTETTDLCQRLHQAGYTLWYEPRVTVTRRVPAASLRRSFFIHLAYWQGCSEALTAYAHSWTHHQGTTAFTLAGLLRSLWPTLCKTVRLALRPLQANKQNDQLPATMALARHWGHFWQRLRIVEHVPAEITEPSVLLVGSSKQAIAPLAGGLYAHQARYMTSVNKLPLAWLWQHRAYDRQSIGIIHCYRPGDLCLNYWQHLQFYWHLWLAQKFGLRIVSTDAGGWWQSGRNLRFLSRRTFEQKLFSCSDIIIAYTRRPEEVYIDKIVRRRVRCLIHPGLRGRYPEPLDGIEARARLGLEQGIVFLCFASQHTEREILYLIDAFSEAALQTTTLQLLIAGFPCDKKQSQQILQQAAHNSAIHLCREERPEDMPLLMGAAHAVVMPHFASQLAGVLETAMLFISYEKVAVVPDLPRFRGMLLPQASIFYDPDSLTALVQALIKAQDYSYRLSEKEMIVLDMERSWKLYARRLLHSYRHLLSTPQRRVR